MAFDVMGGWLSPSSSSSPSPLQSNPTPPHLISFRCPPAKLLHLFQRVWRASLRRKAPIMPYHKVAKCREHKRIIAKFETWSLTFFKIISKSAVTSTSSGHHDFPMEFPVSFVEEYTHLIGPLAANVTLKRASGDTLWPVALTERDMGRAAKRTFMYGADGWKKFVDDNGVKEGHMVVFMLIRRAKFVVYIFPMCKRCESCIEVQEHIDSRG